MVVFKSMYKKCIKKSWDEVSDRFLPFVDMLNKQYKILEIVFYPSPLLGGKNNNMILLLI